MPFIKFHGHLTSHNIFINLDNNEDNQYDLKLRIADLENLDFMEYAYMVYNYRITSVWSSPESLEHLKKIHEMTPQMDCYSFGMILWELWHQAVPFDNDI